MSNEVARPGIRLREIEQAKTWLARHENRFQENAEIFDAGRILFALGHALEGCSSHEELLEMESLLQSVRERFHSDLLATDTSTSFAVACQVAELNALEVEVLLGLSLTAFGLLESSNWISDVEDLQKLLRPCGIDPLGVARAVAPNSRLATSGLVKITESELPVRCGVALSMELVHSLWDQKQSAYWRFQNPEDAHDQLRRIVLAAHRQLKRTEKDESLAMQDSALDRLSCQMEAMVNGFHSGLKQHPDWPMGKALEPLSNQERAILLILVGKELGHLPQEHRIFRGFGLAGSVAFSPGGIRSAIGKLRKDGALRSAGLMRPCGGMPPGVLEEDDATLRSAEFELSGRCRKTLGIERQWSCRSGNLRKANTQLQNLILHQEVTTALAHALQYAKRPERLLDDWGLRAMIPYGHGTTMLFTGPPGVGKTAAAEAFARELDKPILVIDYSALQSCWVGETEKNVVRAFREAADEDAVLFFDEADAVFYNRDSAIRSWEVSEVNVLLKEVEAFAGVCILATNRDTVLDPALERRISRRINFAPPTPAMSAQIWQKLIPSAMPLLGKPDFVQLGAVGLTGGQIKNAVLNAARAAACRGGGDVGEGVEGAGVMMEDFSAAAEIEAGRVESGGIGFVSACRGGGS
ncbi:MAG: ATP-binding protein [Planctomycetota bacterium]|nr:ATP-binding protein [Planctomycetota bacterium]